jgi:hypothetical protein
MEEMREIERFSNLFVSMLSNPALSHNLHYRLFPEMLNILTKFEIKVIVIT